ncbi:hypothetical protein DFH11DRAFT_1810544 [Phellopilus nigrolimitatus]|nr:hypothetical protein DFH11DRAFT_1810544 [Phellopilus nigrolimitatus]
MCDGDDVVPISGEEDDMMELAARIRLLVLRGFFHSQSLKAPLMHVLPPKPVVTTGPSFRARTQSHSNFMAARMLQRRLIEALQLFPFVPFLHISISSQFYFYASIGYRSRSPQPRVREREPYFTNNDTVPVFDGPIASRGSFTRQGSGRAAFQQSGMAQRQAWNAPTQSRRDAEASPVTYDAPPRRPREPEYTPKMNMGVDAKRRRLDDRADSTHRRPKAVSREQQQFPTAKAPSAWPTSTVKQQRPGKQRVFRSPRYGNIDGRSTNNGALIPSGPRLRNQPRPTIDPDFREPTDLYRRQLPPAGPASYNQQPSRLTRRDSRTFDGGRPTDHRSDRNRSTEPMDVDGPSRSKFVPPQNSGPMYSERLVEGDRHDSMDNLPTGPRAMHTEGSGQTSPVVSLSTLQVPLLGYPS